MSCCGGGHHGQMQHGHHGYGDAYEAGQPQVRRSMASTPIELLKERLAKGEITLSEYQEIAQALSS